MGKWRRPQQTPGPAGQPFRALYVYFFPFIRIGAGCARAGGRDGGGGAAPRPAGQPARVCEARRHPARRQAGGAGRVVVSSPAAGRHRLGLCRWVAYLDTVNAGMYRAHG